MLELSNSRQHSSPKYDQSTRLRSLAMVRISCPVNAKASLETSFQLDPTDQMRTGVDHVAKADFRHEGGNSACTRGSAGRS